MIRVTTVNESFNDRIVESYDNWDLVNSIEYSNPSARYGAGLPGISNESAFAKALDKVGKDRFIIPFGRLNGISRADIKDTFGGNYFQKHYGWDCWLTEKDGKTFLACQKI